jgi:hypothetical protein
MAPPHPQPKYGFDEKAEQVHPDGVPSPWILQYSLSNESYKGVKPPDSRRSAHRAYEWNIRNLMNPALICLNSVGQDLILRSLDAGRKGGADTGWGRPETGATTVETAPAYLRKIFEDECQQDEGNYFLQNLDAAQPVGTGASTSNYDSSGMSTDLFHNRRLYKLVEEKELVWDGGQIDFRKMAKNRGAAEASGDGAGERGHFPYVDEQASLIDDLQLREILRIRHRMNRRRHFKWIEMSYQYKKWHQQYLRRRAMANDEVKARMGVLRQTLSQG